VAARRTTGRPMSETGRARIAPALRLAVMCLLASGAAMAAEVSRWSPLELTVAILDLAEAPGLQPPRQAREPEPPWRTSFGSERKTMPETKVAKAGGPLAARAAADAVLIQGVDAAFPLKRLFPPQTWRLIISRASASAGSAPSDSDEAAVSAALPAGTAIAVKARRSLRVTARTSALRTGDAPDAPQPAVAATAVRVVEHGRPLWLASVALPASCAGEPASCPARRELQAWREAKRGAGEATVVGGRLPGAVAQTRDAAPHPACAAHAIETDLQSRQLPAAETATNGGGCISIVRVGEALIH